MFREICCAAFCLDVRGELSLHRFAFTVAKNAVANVARGGASAVAALVLPIFLTRALTHERFAAWSLMLQIAAYAGYLDFGLQTAVARYLSKSIEERNLEMQNELLSTSFLMLTAAGIVAFALIGLVAAELPHLFHGVPSDLLGEARAGILLLAMSAAILLPVSTFTGALIGLHMNEYPALAIGSSRIAGALIVILVVRHTQSLEWLALCISGPNIVGGFVQYLIARKMLPAMSVTLSGVKSSMIKELARYCSVLTFFSFGMLLISGLDVTIVGYYNFQAVGYYSIASTTIMFFTGLSGAVFSAFISPFAVLQSRGEYARIKDSVITSTRLSTYASLVLLSTVVLYGKPAMRLWVGTGYAALSLPILEILLIAQAVRLIGNPYASSLLALGEQKHALFPGSIEAFSNLVLSILGMLWLGPIGVALGTLISAILGLFVYIGHTIQSVKVIPLQRTQFLRECIARPTACMIPVLGISIWERNRPQTHTSEWILMLSLSITIWLTMKYGRALQSLYQ